MNPLTNVIVPNTGQETELSPSPEPFASPPEPISSEVKESVTRTPRPQPPPMPAELAELYQAQGTVAPVNTVHSISDRAIEQLSTTQIEMLRGLGQQTFTYQQIDKSMDSNYNYKESNHSMICDIIALYLKGQKILYTESKSLCEYRLNYLMLPTICITAVCTVISIALKEYPYGALLVSSLNALNFFFLNLINYLKLDAKAEAHRVSAYKFDKIQSKLEFNSGKMLFIYGAHREIEKLINDTEKDVREIKETNQFILPELIRHNYPRLHNVNVFSEVKKIQSEEIMIVNHLKDIMNELVNNKLLLQNDPTNDAIKKKITRLESDRQHRTDAYIMMKDKYLEIDKLFEEEMEEQRNRMLREQYGSPCSFLKT
jgi:hypothetical protein